jgi:hypothetical protein
LSLRDVANYRLTTWMNMHVFDTNHLLTAAAQFG